MKTKLIAITCATLAQGYAATNVGLVNFSGATQGLPIVDNAGVPIDSNSLSLSVGTFTSVFAAGFGGLSIDSADAEVLAAFSPTGSSVAANPTNVAGIFNTSVTDADNGNSLAGQDVYLLIQDTSAASAQVIVINLGTTFPTQDGTGAGAIPGRLLTLGDVVFGETNGGAGYPVDTSTLPAPFQTGGFDAGIGFDTIPEPSTSLLAALAGLGLIARRRR